MELKICFNMECLYYSKGNSFRSKTVIIYASMFFIKSESDSFVIIWK